MVVDTVKPKVTLGSDKPFVQETLCTPTMSAGVLNYGCPSSAGTKLSKVCSPNCGKLYKFPHRLALGLELPLDKAVEVHNIPHLVVNTSDNSQVSSPAGHPITSARFVWPPGEEPQTVSWIEVVGGIVPISSTWFAPGLPVVDSTTSLPAGVEIRAVDEAGNESDTLTFTFKLLLVSPPLLVEIATGPAQPQLLTGAKMSLAANNLHFPFSTNSDAALVGRLLVWNPYPIPVALSAVESVSAAAVSATATGERRYGAETPEALLPTECGSDTCIYIAHSYADEPGPVGPCDGVPPAAPPWVRRATASGLRFMLRHDFTEPASELVSPEWLQPLDEVWVDIHAAFDNSCLILPPTSIVGLGPGAVYVRPDGKGCANAKALSTSDTAYCWYQQKCGFDCAVGGQPPCSSCKELTFSRPWVSLVQSLQFSTEVDVPLPLSVRSIVDGALISAYDSGLVNLGVDATISTTSGVDEPFPTWTK